MFGSLGLPEILFILVLALLVFGPRRLPEVGRTIGRALGEFRRATGDLKRTFDQETSKFERETGIGSAAGRPNSAPRPIRPESSEAGSPAEPEPDAEANAEAEAEAETGAEVERVSKPESGVEGTEPS